MSSESVKTEDMRTASRIVSAGCKYNMEDNMKVTYLGHSGFFVETQQAYYLFDYIRGQVPEPEGGKPLYVFASHSHGDHFSEKIFRPEEVPTAERYILSYDIIKKYRKGKVQWATDYQDKICRAQPGQAITLPRCRVTSLKSTDIGAAYLIEEDDCRIYHAGDLNWWYWEGEALAWNHNMEINYKREIDRLKGMEMDVAFVPLDPRLESGYWYGLDYFLQNVPAKHVFPMHFWKDYSVIDRYLKEHGGEGQIHKIEREGQSYEI